VITLSKKYSVPIIPVNITARNSLLFYLMDIIHPTLKDITLFSEIFNKKNFHFSLKFGHAIFPEDLCQNAEDATYMVKQSVLDLKKSSF
tara:strand:+ start:1503 stop:1769 length:267 start_codon:yes stop_codon:yes gene_type:complete